MNNLTHQKARLLGGRCWYCGQTMNMVDGDRQAQEEHLIPKSREWTYVARPENIVVACKRCNNTKGTMDLEAYGRYLRYYSGGPQIIFFGKLLLNLRRRLDRKELALPDKGLNDSQIDNVLNEARQGGSARLRSWHQDPIAADADYRAGLRLPLPFDRWPFPLGALHRLPHYPSRPIREDTPVDFG